MSHVFDGTFDVTSSHDPNFFCRMLVKVYFYDGTTLKEKIITCKKNRAMF